MKINNPLTGEESHISVVLTMLASQENCDGDPYDQMMTAADYIIRLESQVANLQGTLAIYESIRRRGA